MNKSKISLIIKSISVKTKSLLSRISGTCDHLLEEWITIIGSLCAVVVFVLLLAVIRGWRVNEHIERLLDISSNLLLILGAAWTVLGVHISKTERAELKASELTGALINPKTLAKMLRLASSYATTGLVFLIFGVAVALLKPLAPSVEPSGALQKIHHPECSPEQKSSEAK